MANRRAIHDRLLRLFDGDGYEVFNAGNYVFVKQWNGNTRVWQVAIYPKNNWNKHKQWREASRIHTELDAELDRLLK